GGDVPVSGGTANTIDDAELYDPASGRFLCADGSMRSANPPACPSTTRMLTARASHAAALDPSSGMVFLTGGFKGVARVIPNAPVDHPILGASAISSIE